MAPPEPKPTTLVHLTATGHVLAAVSAAGLKPDLVALTGGHVRVRVPGTDEFVNVPAASLAATVVDVRADLRVLTQSMHYAVKTTGPGAPSAALVGAPTSTGNPPTGTQGDAFVAAWHDDDSTPMATGAVGANGKPGVTTPGGATAELIAIAGQPLCIRHA